MFKLVVGTSTTADQLIERLKKEVSTRMAVAVLPPTDCGTQLHMAGVP
jgi:hypothetical protein